MWAKMSATRGGATTGERGACAPRSAPNGLGPSTYSRLKSRERAAGAVVAPSCNKGGATTGWQARGEEHIPLLLTRPHNQMLAWPEKSRMSPFPPRGQGPLHRPSAQSLHMVYQSAVPGPMLSNVNIFRCPQVLRRSKAYPVPPGHRANPGKRMRMTPADVPAQALALT